MERKMNRREFILNTSLALSASTMLTGFTEKKVILKEGEVAKRKFKDLEIPLLGFGLMRLPMMKNNEKEVDMQELEAMVEYAMNHGANYFDTAYMYVDEKSETSIGKILKKYDRKDFFLADKSPIYKMKTKDDVRKIFEKQL